MEAPLDYSFYSMTVLSDISGWEARQGFMPSPRKTQPGSEVKDSEPRQSIAHPTKHSQQKKKSGKSKSKCFKLNNNCLSDITELKLVAETIFEDVEEVAWLDLSFNELTKIDDILTEFPRLQILYLHGNQISDLKEVEKLARIPTLKKLSLHGNPVENDKAYKYTVTAMLPNLQVLDFAKITKANRRTADTLDKMMGSGSKKNKKKVVEQD